MPSQLDDSDDLAKSWSENPDLLRSFIEVRPQYEHLGNEVEYILNKRLGEKGVEFSTVISRPKSLRSFAEKLSRKQYQNPLSDITDLAGVRVVYLYKSDLSKIEEVIEAEFKVIEKIDKVEEQDTDKFGYGALHYLVHVGRKSSGARYDDLKSLVCEIQVRTVLQDAWAIIAHHLSYKQESDIPKVLRRKLNSLSGLFETADDQFDQVRAERREYQETIKRKAKKESEFLNQEINLDTFTEFLKWKFPNQVASLIHNHTARVLSRTSEFGYKRLSELNDALDRTETARTLFNQGEAKRPATAEVAVAIAFLHPEYRARVGGATTQALIDKYEDLVS